MHGPGTVGSADEVPSVGGCGEDQVMRGADQAGLPSIREAACTSRPGLGFGGRQELFAQRAAEPALELGVAPSPGAHEPPEDVAGGEDPHDVDGGGAVGPDHWPRRTARICSDAMVALGLLERDGPLYTNSPAADAFLSGRDPAIGARSSASWIGG